MRGFWSKRGALPSAQFDALRETFLASPLVGGSTLAGPFESSRGFGLTFREQGRSRVIDRFPALAPHFELVLGAPAIRALTSFWRRTLKRIPNAWYMNVLLVSPGGGTVARHVDATLRKPSGVDTAVPEVVSVLYLKVPSRRGGELRLWEGPDEIARLVPEENAVLHFRGELAHEVCAFEAPEGQHRASLVIEQYHFEPDALARLPEFQLESRAGFGAFLKHHEEHGPTSFELES